MARVLLLDEGGGFAVMDLLRREGRWIRCDGLAAAGRVDKSEVR